MSLKTKIEKRIKLLIAMVIIGLLLAGLSVFPIHFELEILLSWFGEGSYIGQLYPIIPQWLEHIQKGIIETRANYPFLLYGLDWLGFAHFVIAIVFIGPYRDPVKNIWVVEFGMIASLLIIPFAFIMGYFRNIPLFWTLIDSSFGVFCLIPLWYARYLIKQLATDQ